jgi:hypothetical protein
MKKFLIVIMAIFIANLGCKKINDSDGLCACSPIHYPYLSLVVKNSADQDLLDTKTAGAFAKDKIQLYYKESNGNTKQIAFFIHPPFSYGTDQFKFSQLNSEEIVALSNNQVNTFFLKLGDNTPYELKLQFNTTKNRVEKLMVDNTEAVAETGKVTNYVDGNIFNLIR